MDEADDSSQPVIGSGAASGEDWSSDLADLMRSQCNLNARTKDEKYERMCEDLRFRDDKSNFVVTGERFAASNKHVRRVRLPDKKPPNSMYETMKMRFSQIRELYPVLDEVVTPRNYVNKFTILLQLEEVEFDVNLKMYDMDNVTMSRKRDFLVLDVPGLAEGRPSLMIGDSAIIRLRTPGQNKKYEGVIHAVEKDDILMKFNSVFAQNYSGESVNASFKVSRTTVRRNHYAVENAMTLNSLLLFPTHIPFRETAPLQTSIKWVNTDLNERQRKAVEWILRGECRPAPYVIFGPPGTGKTVTVVETILQIWKREPNARVLAMAGSNSCADAIAKKLVQSKAVGRSDMVRLVSFQRSEHVPDYLKPYSSMCNDDKEQWLNHRIIVSTCCNSGAIFNHRPKPGHFTHVIIDEAATVTEPESLIGILLAANSGTTVLVGDPYQLGPVIQSKIAKEKGLGVSLLSRIYNMSPYTRDTSANPEFGYYDPRCITKLIESYRCCEELIHVNNRLFYHSELVCHPERNQRLLDRMKLRFPILFHGVQGTDMQETDNPSWFNAQEAVTAVQYLNTLYNSGLKPDDVGVITPYRKQADKIRQLTNRGLNKAIGKVSTIEDFQGLEREVIILSLVRSSPRLLAHDLRFNLGFLFDAKRFNVSTSRAKSLLIVIGDPFLLQKDECWKQLLKHCIQNDAYKGCDFSLNDDN